MSIEKVSFSCRNCLQQTFEMSSLCANICLQTLYPLTDGSIANVQLQTTPDVNQSLPEFMDIADLCLILIDTLLYNSPNLVVNGV